MTEWSSEWKKERIRLVCRILDGRNEWGCLGNSTGSISFVDVVGWFGFIDFDGGDVAGGLLVGWFGVVAVGGFVVFRGVGVVGEGGHDEVTLNPVFVLPG